MPVACNGEAETGLVDTGIWNTVQAASQRKRARTGYLVDEAGKMGFKTGLYFTPISWGGVSGWIKG